MRTAMLLVLAAACSKRSDKKPEPAAGAPDAPPAPPPLDAPVGCPEKHDVDIVLAAGEAAAPPAGRFEVKDSVAYRSGTSWNGAAVTKDLHVVLAGYDTWVGPYLFEPPRRPGQVALQLRFSTAHAPATREQQREVYRKLELAPGDYPIAYGSEEAQLAVNIWMGSATPSGYGIDRATGGATITSLAPDRACGRLDLTSPAGTTIRGTFNVPIEKDLWQ